MSSEKIKVVISIINHDHDELIDKLILSFDRYLKITKNISLKIVILNNLNTMKIFKSMKFEIFQFQNTRALSFSQNHNQIFSMTNNDYFIVMNPDIALIDNFDLGAFIEGHDNAEIISPIQLNKNLEVLDFIRRDITIKNLFIRKFGKEKCSYNDFDWLSGAFMSFSASAFRALGGFDVRYRMYVEDCDLCRRAKDLGFNLIVAEDYSVLHDTRRESFKNLQHLKWHIKSILIYWYMSLLRFFR